MAIDTPIDVPPPSPVTITVTQGGNPLAAQTVYFQESDATLVRAMQTGADGKASAVVHAGGFVTVVQPPPPLPLVAASPSEVPQIHSDLTTFAGVKPGDDLHLDLDPATQTGTEITFNLSVPNEELGRTYVLYSSCGDPQSLGIGNSPVQASRRAGSTAAAAIPVTKPVTLRGCGGAADLLVVSTDTETQTQIFSWLYKPAFPVANGNDATLDDAYQLATDVDFTYTNVASTNNDLSVQRELDSPRGSLEFFAQQTATPDTGTAIATMTLPLAGVAGILAVTTTTENPNVGHGQQRVVEWGENKDYALGGAAMLHHYASAPSVDAGSHVIQWSEDGGGGAPDFVLGRYDLSRFDDSGQNTWSWQIVAPYTAGQPKLTYPVLPTTLYDYNPAAGEQPAVQQLTTVKAPGGYDAARAHAFNGDPAFAIAGASGRIVVEDMFEPRATATATATTAPRRALSGRLVPRRR